MCKQKTFLFSVAHHQYVDSMKINMNMRPETIRSETLTAAIIEILSQYHARRQHVVGLMVSDGTKNDLHFYDESNIDERWLVHTS